MSCSWRSLFRRGRKISRVQFRKPARALRRQKLMARKRKPALNEAPEALQKATENPVASLISVPVQNNLNFGVNPGYRNQDVLNIAASNSDRRLKRLDTSNHAGGLHRSSVSEPTRTHPELPRTGEYGLGDMVLIRFCMPFHRRSLVDKLNLGVVTSMASCRRRQILSGTGKLCLGPTVVALLQPGHCDAGGCWLIMCGRWRATGAVRT